MARSEARLLFGVMKGLRGLAIESKVLYMALLVEPTLNQAGVGALRETLWSKETELSATATRTALGELNEKRYALVDYETEEVFVRTLIRNDGVADRPNVLWAACRAAEMVQSSRLRHALAEELRRLPPKPADKVTKSGGMYVHPDPHAVADKIDPGPPSDPREEPFPNPSRTLPQANCSRTVREPPGVVVGVGEGGSTPVTTPDQIKAAARREMIETAGCAVHATIPTGVPTGVRRQLVEVAAELLAGGTSPDVLTAGLIKWRGRPDAGPRLLPHLVADVVRERARPAAPRKPSTTDQRVADILALRAEMCGGPTPTVPDFFALPGGAA